MSTPPNQPHAQADEVIRLRNKPKPPLPTMPEGEVNPNVGPLAVSFCLWAVLLIGGIIASLTLDWRLDELETTRGPVLTEALRRDRAGDLERITADVADQLTALEGRMRLATTSVSDDAAESHEALLTMLAGTHEQIAGLRFVLRELVDITSGQLTTSEQETFERQLERGLNW